MSPILSSQSLVIATAMVVSSTALFLAFTKHERAVPRSCLCSGEKRKKTKTTKKKKKVRFAEDVKEPSGNGERYRREHGKSCCRDEIPGAPANRVALYNGILKEKSMQRLLECSS